MTKKLLSLLILTAAALLVGLILWLVFRPQNPSTTPATQKEQLSPTPPSPLLSLKGFSSSVHHGETLFSKIAAEELVAVPRKFGIFKINSAYDLTLRDARMEYHLGTGRPPAGFDPFADAFTAAAGTGDKSRIGSILKRSIKGLDLQIFQDGKANVRVSAEDTVYDPKSGKTRLKKILVEHLPSGRKIAGHKALWNPETFAFLIDGEYLLETKQGAEKGRGLAVRLDFQVRRL